MSIFACPKVVTDLKNTLYYLQDGEVGKVGRWEGGEVGKVEEVGMCLGGKVGGSWFYSRVGDRE